MAMSLSRMERQVLAGFAICVVIMAVLHEVMQLKELGMAIQKQLLEDYYTTLGVSDTASPSDIALAFKRATNQFNSRPQDEDGRIRRALIVTAHETLSNADLRAAYDHRRRVVKLTSDGLTVACVGVPVLLIFVLLHKLARRFSLFGGSEGLDPKSFEGRLNTAIQRLEMTVDVVVSRGDPAEKLGIQLAPGSKASSIAVTSVGEGLAMDKHNLTSRSSGPPAAIPGEGLSSWHSQEILPGDEFISVQGVVRPHEMMEKLKAATTSLMLTVHRPIQALLPWIAELELTRSSAQERWGCQMTSPKDGTDNLEVVEVDPSGVVARWNLMNPPLAVRPCDRILAVNREFGSDRMLASLRDPSRMEVNWVIVRGIRDSRPRPAEKDYGPFKRRRADDKLGIRIGPALQSPVKGTIVETSGAAAMVVKQVLPGYLVDGWNRGAGAEAPVLEGATVVSVNGRTDPREFSNELKKDEVSLKLRPPRGSEQASSTDGQPDGGAVNGTASRASSSRSAEVRREPSSSTGGPPPAALQLEKEPWARRLCGSRAPSFLLPRSFESRLRDNLSRLRCEFFVTVSRGDGGVQRVGLNLVPARDALGGLDVMDVALDGLVGRHNSGVTASNRRQKPEVRAGDRLISVNGITPAPMMLEVLADTSKTDFNLCFSRKAAEASPGVWEAEVTRSESEGWGMELQEHASTPGLGGHNVLKIMGIRDGGSVDRWNCGALEGTRWAVEPGDLLVAVEPEVSGPAMLARLKATQYARLTLLRWHCGPAPESTHDGESNGAGGDGLQANGYSTFHFEVTLERASSSDRLGIRLDPSARDPTRTAVAEVLPGGLVELHNRQVVAEALTEMSRGAVNSKIPDQVAARLKIISPGDEVDAVNGERDPVRFSDCCRAPRVVLRLSRRADAVVPLVPSPSPATSAPAPPPTAEAPPMQASPPVASMPAPPAPRTAPATSAPPPAPPAAPPPSAAALAPAAAAAAVLPERASKGLTAPEAQAAAVEAQQPESAVPAPASQAEAPKQQPPPPPSPPQQQQQQQPKITAAAVAAPSPAAAKELASLRAERDALKAELESVRQVNARQERGAQAERRRAKEEAQALEAQVAELRATEQQLRAQLSRSEALSAANTQLTTENAELRAQLQSLQEAGRRPATEHNGDGGACPEMLSAQLEPLDEGFVRLQELSAQLDRALAPDW